MFWACKLSAKVGVLGGPCDSQEEYETSEKALCGSDTEYAADLICGDTASCTSLFSSLLVAPVTHEILSSVIRFWIFFL